MKRLGPPVLSVFVAACGGSPGSGGVPGAPPGSPAHGSEGDVPRPGHGHEHGPGDAAGHPHPGHGHDHAHGPMPHRFEDAEAWAKVFDEPGRDAWQRPDEVVQLVDARPGATVADLGAGTGYFLGRLARAVGPSGRVLGLDVEPDMARYMAERAAREGLANVEARAVKADDPGLAEGSVDRVLVVDTWHHIGDRSRYVPKLVRALRPGGAVVVVDFPLDGRRGPPAQHRVAAEQVVAELAAAGLRASVVAESLPDQYVVRGEKP